MTLNTCELWFNGIKIAFFPKNRPTAGPPKPPAAGDPAPKPPSVIHLSYTSFLNTFPKLDTCIFSTISLSPLPLQNPGYVQTGNNDFRSSISLSHKKFLFGKILMTSFHVICGLGLSIKNSGYANELEIAWKKFLKTFFFFGRTLASVSLASSIPVLGLKCVCPRKGCPWPRLYLCLVCLRNT